MKITNKLNLPVQFVNAINKEYKPTPHQYSVTTILNSTRQIILQRRHNNEIVADVSDQIWALFGTLFHGLLEASQEGENELKEEYIKINLKCLDERLNGYFLSGKADLFSAKEKKIIDFKTTSTFKFVKKDFEDYRLQTLMYAWMFKQLGFEVDKGEIIGVLRDWQKSKSLFDRTYPTSQVQVVTFNFKEKDFKDIEEFIKNKFLELKECEEKEESELPLCSPEDRWSEPPKYAVKKKGNKKAIKLHDTLEEAKEHIEKLTQKSDDKYEIESRPGNDRKCDGYCSACSFCWYWKEKYMKEEVNVNE